MTSQPVSSSKQKKAKKKIGTPVRSKSVRNAQKNDEIIFPADHAFLVYFDDERTFALVAPDHTSWPVHLLVSEKLSMRHQDVFFKSSEKPGSFIKGKVLTNGPEDVIERVGDYMNFQIEPGLQLEDMNVTKVFQRAVKELSLQKKNLRRKVKMGKDKVVDAASRTPLKDIQQNENDQCDDTDGGEKSDDESSALASDIDNEPDQPCFAAGSVKVQENKMALATNVELVTFFIYLVLIRLQNFLKIFEMRLKVHFKTLRY